MKHGLKESQSWQWEEVVQDRLTRMVDEELPTINETESATSSPTHTSPSSSTSSSPKPSPSRMRLPEEIYERTYVCQFNSTLEYEIFEDAVKSLDWCKSMEEEISVLEQNQTWELVDLPPDKEAIGLKWIYKTKFKPDGSIQKLKARIITEWYLQ
ncbi:uncharacterized protein LOC109719721 [Ananas comosus]|uniref:Uncharacterized protein LOC109719721 n=1 Tax=Ananas comosus TaxID=4615 RepID=A0A6P5G0G5_ANACO|nr:uncharacterized protein LOC109719721 [Ananas comosus]